VTFRVVNSNQFGVNLNAKYPVAVDELGNTAINVFIYNKLSFSNLYIDIKYQIVTFQNLGSTDQTAIFNAPFVPTTTNSIVFGMNGLDISGFLELGFDFTLNSVPVGKDYTFILRNLWLSTSFLRLDFFILLPSEFRCPNNETNIDPTLSFCYTSCPSHEFTSSNEVAITGIYKC
jgi:hypothetical protein